jgi:60 kDa SS-A/Ro ribonucleoprotein
MQSPITGDRGSVSSAVQCSDVAALFAASILRENPQSRVISFDDSARFVRLNSRDSIVTNAQSIKPYGSATNLPAALELIAESKTSVDLIVIFSDNQSWFTDNQKDGSSNSMKWWRAIQAQNKNVKCVCVDIAPEETTSLQEGNNVYNIAGFSDAIFDLLKTIVEGGNCFKQQIEAVNLD